MTNEDRLDLFADLIEPAGELMGDKEVVKLLQTGKVAKAVNKAIKGHKAAVIELLARLDGKTPEEYIVPGPIGMMTKLLKLANDPELQQLFQLQDQNDLAASSGPVTEHIKDGAI